MLALPTVPELSAYSAFQPPATLCAAAMLPRLSPGDDGVAARDGGSRSGLRGRLGRGLRSSLGLRGRGAHRGRRRGRVAGGTGLARAHRPRAPTLGGEHTLGDGDLLLAARAGRGAGTPVGAPRRGRELETAGVAVAGVDAPVAAALTLRDLVPDAGGGGLGVAASAIGAPTAIAPATARRTRPRPVRSAGREVMNVVLHAHRRASRTNHIRDVFPRPCPTSPGRRTGSVGQGLVRRIRMAIGSTVVRPSRNATDCAREFVHCRPGEHSHVTTTLSDSADKPAGQQLDIQP